MNDIAINVQNLSKRYRIGAREASYRTFRETLVDAAKAPFQRLAKAFKTDAPDSAVDGRPSSVDNTIWALKDVSFEVKHGEVLGIIGRNGAGKSTLLKILAKITEPTEGRVELRGRIGSLLEIGTGFHPELTGHENIYLYGAILGMDRWEVTRKFDEIVAFAELEKFIDTPVKRYSTGMHMRLAFAVAAHLEPEILLVDEVLAVGDAAFQKKCMGKMGDVSEQGRTVLFVSHNMGAIRKLCMAGLLLDSGTVDEYGPVSKCISRYLFGVAPGTSELITDHIRQQNEAIGIDSLMVNNSPYDTLEITGASDKLKIDISGTLSRSISLEVEARIYDLYDNPLAFFSPGHDKGSILKYPCGPFNITRYLKLPRIMRGEYYLSLFLTTPDIYGWLSIPHALRLIVEGTPTSTGRVFDYYQQGTGWVFLSEAPADDL